MSEKIGEVTVWTMYDDYPHNWVIMDDNSGMSIQQQVDRAHSEIVTSLVRYGYKIRRDAKTCLVRKIDKGDEK